MCWLGFNQNRKVAEKDTRVYKVLYKLPDSGEYRAIYYSFKYCTGCEYKSEIKKSAIVRYEFDKCDSVIGTTLFYRDSDGYPAGKCNIPPSWNDEKFKSLGPMVINKGIHCYSEKLKFKFEKDFLNVDYHLSAYSTDGREISCFPISELPICILSCTIPEGSEYYENEDGEVVTEKLVIGEEVERFENKV